MECDPCEPLDLETEYRELDLLPVVDTVRIDAVNETHGARLPRSSERAICTLWCRHLHPPGDLKQPSVKVNKSTVPSIEHAVRELRAKIVRDHGGCLAAAEAARAAASGPSTRLPSDALAVMMAARKAQQASERGEAALKAAEARAEVARLALAAAELEVSTRKAAAVRVLHLENRFPRAAFSCPALSC